MQTVTLVSRRPATGTHAGKTLYLEVVREPGKRQYASVYAQARLEEQVMGRHMRDLSQTEKDTLTRAGRKEMVAIIGMVGVNAEERYALQACIDAQLGGVTGDQNSPVKAAIATQADYADDPDVQAAWARAQATGQRAFVRTYLDDVHRPDTESDNVRDQECVDLYVEPDGRMSVTVRPVS